MTRKRKIPTVVKALIGIALVIAVVFVAFNAYENYAFEHMFTGIVPDMPGSMDSVGDYMRGLNASSEPRFIALRQQIDDGPADLDKVEAVATRDGIPLINEPAMSADVRTAAIRYHHWFKSWQQRDATYPEYYGSLSYRFVYTKDMLKQSVQYVHLNKPVYNLMFRPVQKSELPVAKIDSAAVRDASREIRSESVLSAIEGNYATAIESQALGFKISKQVQYRPDILNHSLAESIDAITLSGFRSILYLAGPNATVDSRVEESIDKAAPDLSLKSAMIGQIGVEADGVKKLMGQSTFDIAQAAAQTLYPGDSPNWTDNSLSPRELRFCKNVLEASAAQQITGVMKCIPYCGEPQLARTAAIISVDSANSEPFRLQGLDILSFLDGMEKVDGIDVFATPNAAPAQMQVTAAAAHVLSVKAETGQFPQSLPAKYIDPFNGNELGYRLVDNNGFVIYSVGPSGKFDGQPESERADFGQVVFRFPAPKKIPVPKQDD